MKALSFILVVLWGSTLAYGQGNVGGQTPTLLDILSGEDRTAIVDNYLARDRGDQTRTAIRMLSYDLAPYIKTLRRDIVTYNYRPRQETGVADGAVLETDDPQVRTYADQWRNAIFNHNPRESGMVGWGLYSARDPLASQSYGRGIEEFNLTTVRYPNGSKMLDLREANGNLIPISQTTKDYLTQICPNSVGSAYPLRNNQGRVPNMYAVDKSDLTRDLACHDIFVGALRSLDIDGLIYQWDSSGTMSDICDTTNTRNSGAAFVAVGVELNEANTDMLMNQNSTPPEISQQLMQFFNQAQQTVNASTQAEMTRLNTEMQAMYQKLNASYNTPAYQKYFDEYNTKQTELFQIMTNNQNEIQRQVSAERVRLMATLPPRDPIANWDQNDVRTYEKIVTAMEPPPATSNNKNSMSGGTYGGMYAGGFGGGGFGGGYGNLGTFRDAMTLTGETITPQERDTYRAELKSETFGCDARYDQDDSPTYNPNQVYRYLLSDGLDGLDRTLRQRIEMCIGEQ